MNFLSKLLKKGRKFIAIVLLIKTWHVPVFMLMLVVVLGDDYIDAIDVEFEYLGKEAFKRQESNNVEINAPIDGNDFWAYIADNEEEYCSYYGQNGMSDDIYEQVDFDNYIMVMSVNRPITAIRIMKNYPVGWGLAPYSYPQFVFGREEERDMVYYYKVYRIDTTYRKRGQEITSRLKLWPESYFEQKEDKYPKPEPMIESWGPFKRWKWVFDVLNHI